MEKWDPDGLRRRWKYALVVGLADILIAAVGSTVLWVTLGAEGSWWTIPIFPLCAGVVMVIISVVFYMLWRRKQRWRAALKKDGVLLKAQYTGCENSLWLGSDGPLVNMECSYTDADGKRYIFKRKNLPEDPLPYLQDGIVNVYCKRDDYSVYFADIVGSIYPHLA